jgi:hypothetical protein
MEHAARPGRFSQLGRVLLLLAGLDSLALGTWASTRPADLFQWVALAPSEDALRLWQVVGVLTLGQVPCLVLAAARPARFGGLVVAPVFGRALQAGLWLWLLGTPQVRVATPPVLLLCAHDVFGFAALLGWLGFWGWQGFKGRVR